jgi:pimeloyl-ACP methyl ester carboxylesterase
MRWKFLVTNAVLFTLTLLSDASATGGLVKGQVKGSERTLVVFVHGFLGAPESTWTNEITKNDWASLLVTDKDAGVALDAFVFGYRSSVSAEALEITEIAASLELQISEISRANKYNRIVFVGHSMGGLVIRETLLSFKSLADRTAALVLLGTPTNGSQIAQIVRLIPFQTSIRQLLPSSSNQYLSDVTNRWSRAETRAGLRFSDAFKTHCLYERRSTKNLLIVDKQSATSLCNGEIEAVDDDHVGIAKPADRSSEQYLRLRRIIARLNKGNSVAIAPFTRSNRAGTSGAPSRRDSPVVIPKKIELPVLSGSTTTAQPLRAPEQTQQQVVKQTNPRPEAAPGINKAMSADAADNLQRIKPQKTEPSRPDTQKPVEQTTSDSLGKKSSPEIGVRSADIFIAITEICANGIGSKSNIPDCIQAAKSPALAEACLKLGSDSYRIQCMKIASDASVVSNCKSAMYSDSYVNICIEIAPSRNMLDACRGAFSDSPIIECLRALKARLATPR